MASDSFPNHSVSGIVGGLFHKQFLAKATTLPIGVDQNDEVGTPYYNYNVALGIASNRPTTWSIKSRLVPFEETIPFADRLRLRLFMPKKITGYLNSPKSEKPAIIRTKTGSKVGTLICYEAAFGHRAAKAAANGASMLAVLTNEGWFEGSRTAKMFSALTAMRALEVRKPTIRSSNRGQSAIFDGNGRTITAVSGNKTALLSAQINPNRKMTTYALFGDLLGFLCLFSLLVTTVFVRIRQRHFPFSSSRLQAAATALCLVFLTTTLSAQSVSGTVSQPEASQPLTGATIRLLGTDRGTTTNSTGQYQLPLTSTDTTFRVVVSYVGFQPDTSGILRPLPDLRYNVTLRPDATALVVEVTGQRNRRDRQLLISTNRLAATEISAFPVLLGEADVLRSLQFLPGVQSGVEGQAGLFVRGGSADQNLILLDGAPVYNPNHVFGFFSVFNVDAVENVSLMKGGFPARYGGRLSAIVDVEMRGGEATPLRKSITVSPLAAKASLSGRLGSDRTTFLIAGRRTLFDLLAAPFVNAASDRNGADTQERNRLNLHFGDANVKLTHRFSDRAQLTATGYYGQDRFDRYLDRTVTGIDNRSDENLNWSNLIGSTRYRYIQSDRWQHTISATYSRYRYRNGYRRETRQGQRLAVDQLDYTTGVTDLGLRTGTTFRPTPVLTLRAGGGINDRTFETGDFQRYNERRDNSGVEITDTTVARRPGRQQEYFAFLENEIAVGKKLSLNAGLHFVTLGGGPGKLQYRLSVRQEIGPRTVLKFGYADMRQNLHLAVSGSLGLPRDLWIPATERLPPGDSRQATLGIERRLAKGWSLATDVYSKDLKNTVTFRPGAGISTLQDWEDLLLRGTGSTYGAEWLLKRETGRLNGWIAYTLSWAWREFPELNDGQRFPFRYDKRHNFRLLANYELKPEHVFLNGSFTYTSGNPITLTAIGYRPGLSIFPGTIGATNGQVETYRNVNNFRIPPTHRLDLGLTFRKTSKRRMRELTLGVYNAYARRNPYFVYSAPIASPRVQQGLFKVSLFRIVPNLSYSITW